MDTIKELEDRLKEEKLKKRWNEIQDKLKEAKTKYSGKAFGNKALRLNKLSKYMNKNFYITIVYIRDVVLDAGIQTIDDLKRYPECDYNSIRLVGDLFTVSSDNNNRVISSSCNYYWKIRDMMDYGYEIQLETYNKIQELISNSVDLVFLTPYKELKSHWTSSTSLYCTKFLKNSGCQLIDLTEDEVYAIKDHPFLYGSELLVSDLSRKIIEDFRKEEVKNDSVDVGFYCCGEYVKPTGISKRKIEKLDSILKKFPPSIN